MENTNNFLPENKSVLLEHKLVMEKANALINEEVEALKLTDTEESQALTEYIRAQMGLAMSKSELISPAVTSKKSGTGKPKKTSKDKAKAKVAKLSKRNNRK